MNGQQSETLIFLVMAIFAIFGTFIGLSEALAVKRHNRRMEELKYYE